MQTEKASGKPENERKPMNVTFEMKQSIITLAGPRQPEDTRESMIRRAARRAGISFRQAKSYFYGEASDFRMSGVERVRAAIAKANAGQEAKAREEYAAISEQISILEQRLAALAPHLDRTGIDGACARGDGPSKADRAVGLGE